MSLSKEAKGLVADRRRRYKLANHESDAARRLATMLNLPPGMCDYLREMRRNRSFSMFDLGEMSCDRPDDVLKHLDDFHSWKLKQQPPAPDKLARVLAQHAHERLKLEREVDILKQWIPVYEQHRREEHAALITFFVPKPTAQGTKRPAAEAAEAATAAVDRH